MKTKITAIKSYHTSKEGQPLLDKYSRPYARITIQVPEHPGKWISCLTYQNDVQNNWKVGDEVEIDITPNGQYLNFNLSRANKGGSSGNGVNLSNELLEKLYQKVNKIEVDMHSGFKFLAEKLDALETVEEPPADGVNPKKLPF